MRLTVAIIAASVLACSTAWAQRVEPPKPSAGLMPNPARGKVMYEAQCAKCHGRKLEGTDKGPPFLHAVYVHSHHGDASFQLAVRHGARAHHWRFGDMPAVPGLTPDDVAHITAYVRGEQKKSGIH